MRGLGRMLTGLFGALLLSAFWYPEQPISTTRGTGELSLDRGFSFATFYDGGAITVWEDARRTPSETVDAYAARANAAGTVLDPVGFSLTNTGFDQSDPSVACLNAACLFAWQKGAQGVAVRTYDAAAGLFGLERLAGSQPDTGAYQTPWVAAMGPQFVVVWADTSSALSARVFNVDGTPATAVITVATQPSVPFIGNFSAAASTSGFAVVWRDIGSPFAVRQRVFDTAGVPQSAPAVVFPSSEQSSITPAVAAAGASIYMAVISDGSARIAVRRFSDVGFFIDASPVLPLGNTSNRLFPVVTYDGSSAFVLAWADSTTAGTIQGARVSATTSGVLTPAKTIVSDTVPPTALRFSVAQGGRAVLSWTRHFGYSPDGIRAQVVALDATLAPGVADLSSQQTPDVHWVPRVARTASGYLAGWVSRSNGFGTGVIRPLDATGTPSGPEVTLDAAADPYSIDLDFDGLKTHAVWSVSGDVRTALLDSKGTAGAMVTLGSDTVSYVTRVASLPTRSLAVWGYENGVHGRFIEVDGGVTGAGPTINLVVGASVERVDVAAASAQFAVVWQDVLLNQISLARFSVAGVPLGTTVNVSSARAGALSVASDGTDYLVVWTSSANVLLEPIHGVRVSGAGAVLDATPIDLSSPTVKGLVLDSSHPQVAYDGTSYQVAWAEREGDGGTFDVVMQPVSSSGVIGAVTRLATGVDRQYDPALVYGPTGRGGAVWLDSDDLGANVARVRGRTFAAIAPGGVCLGTPECITGLCQLGLCCDPDDGGCSLSADAGAAGGDAGQSLDAGAANDAGLAVDGGTDAGDTSDAGGMASSPDSGLPGVASDGGGRSGQATLHVGCDCQSGTGSMFAWLGLVSLAALRHRRRRNATL